MENFVGFKYDTYLKPSGKRLLGSVFLSDSNGAVSDEHDRAVDLALLEEESPALITDWRQRVDFVVNVKESYCLKMYIK